MIHTIIYSSYSYNPFYSCYNSFLRFQLTYFVTLKHLNFLIIYQETIHPFCFFILLFHILLTPSISTPDFCGHFTILIKSSKLLFKLTKLIPFPALTTRFPSIFLWIEPSITEADSIVANEAKHFSQRNSNLHQWKSNFVKQSFKKSSSLNNFRQLRFTTFYARPYC